MLAVFGFTVGGMLLVLFGATLPVDGTAKQVQIIKDFRLSFWLLAGAFFGYGLASATANDSILALAVILGNVFIFAATFIIIGIFLGKNKYRNVALWTTAIVAALLLIVRLIYFYPTPYMRDSILIFHSQRFVSFMLTSIFLLIWLPVCIRIADQITAHKSVHEFRRPYILLYTIATFAAIMFLLSKEPLPLVLSFIALSTSFLMLLISNIYIAKLEEANG